MSNQELSNLSELLVESHVSTLKLLETVDLELEIYTDPVWRARDVLWHIAAWDRQVIQSIEAFEFGGQYSIPDFDEHEFNSAAIKEGRELSLEQVLKGANQARRQFQRVVERFPADQVNAELLYPWGDESGDIVQLVNYMLDHDEEHRQEILSAVNP
jgi:hypothetical protein